MPTIVNNRIDQVPIFSKKYQPDPLTLASGQ
ncbi:hypothetical protein VIBR0546_18161 [Vibrio brasiliensis LMG 20546]|uniref:Uncharacterized protein n=1 Tax=Vibrio brasiliensis LMG 20546 TaxID=945543 RepID=E8LPU7_9VIBR|nr:hypothetical protein VIBR0546_18161 [Vibrio brasiliensis LMG 20546]